MFAQQGTGPRPMIARDAVMAGSEECWRGASTALAMLHRTESVTSMDSWGISACGAAERVRACTRLPCAALLGDDVTIKTPRSTAEWRKRKFEESSEIKTQVSGEQTQERNSRSSTGVCDGALKGCGLTRIRRHTDRSRESSGRQVQHQGWQ